MGNQVTLKSTDGHSFEMYVAEPSGPAKGAVIVLPEIFGINSHIQSVADRYAKHGYIAGAPALFDRVQAKYVAGYEQADIQAGVAIMQKIPMDQAILDTTAAYKHLRAQHDKVATVGYCWGGTVSWVASAKVPGLSAAICYYPGGLANNASLHPLCPVMLHLGEDDKSPTPQAAKEALASHPTALAYLYKAGHGFNCDQRGSFNADSSRTAEARTLALLELANRRWT